MSAEDNLGRQFFDVEYHASPIRPEKMRVDAQLSNPKMRNVFSSGQCHALALSIHEQGGHPIGAVYYHGSDIPRHFFNYDKDNPKMGFDAKGHRPVKDIAGKSGTWNSATESIDLKPNVHKEVSPAFVRETTENKEGWLAAHHDAARAVAPTILNSRTSPRRK